MSTKETTQDILRDSIYTETVDDPTNFSQLSKFYLRAKMNGLEDPSMISLNKLRTRLVDQTSKKDLYDRNISYAENLASTLIAWMENTFPQAAKETLPKEWKQEIIKYFADRLLLAKEDISFAELRELVGVSEHSVRQDRILDDLVGKLLGAYSTETGRYTKYNPKPLAEPDAFEEWTKARRKVNMIPEQLVAALRSLHVQYR